MPMPEYVYCSGCGQGYYNDSNHECDPYFEVRLEGEEEIDTVRAMDHYCAAEEYASELDNVYAEGPHKYDILVRIPGKTDWRKFHVDFEVCVEYMAREVK